MTQGHSSSLKSLSGPHRFAVLSTNGMSLKVGCNCTTSLHRASGLECDFKVLAFNEISDSEFVKTFSECTSDKCVFATNCILAHGLA